MSKTSRQVKWQHAQVAKGNCASCTAPRGTRSKRLCDRCFKAKLDKTRERMGSKPWVKGKPGRPPANAK